MENLNIPAPVDAVAIKEWEHHPHNSYREFRAGHFHIPGEDDDREFSVWIDGLQHEDGSAFRHIKVCVDDEDDVVEVARFLPKEARRVAIRLLMATEEIESVENQSNDDSDEADEADDGPWLTPESNGDDPVFQPDDGEW